MPLTVTAMPYAGTDELASRWQALESDAAGSIFLRWVWVGSWLGATGAQPELIAVQDDAGRDVALALLGRVADKRVLGRVGTMLLNESGDPLADRVFIEHNGLLARRSMEQEVQTAFATAITARKDWQALRLSGIAPGNALLHAISAHRRVLVDAMPAYGVDLEAVRGAGGDYAALLSANTRQQLRRAARCHGDAALTVTRAGTLGEIREALAAMAELNVGRHADNAWDLPVFQDFCHRLALAGLDTGEVDLIIVSSKAGPVGYLLNLIDGARVLNYQSAFAGLRDAKDKPGLLTHAAAVLHYSAGGRSVYSLLAGRDRYKQSLATMEERLEWWRLERFSVAQEGEYWLRKLLRR